MLLSGVYVRSFVKTHDELFTSILKDNVRPQPACCCGSVWSQAGPCCLQALPVYTSSLKALELTTSMMYLLYRGPLVSYVSRTQPLSVS